MIVLEAGDARFNYRVAGVCVHDGHVLLHCWERCEFWALPGGRPELFESSRDALVREMWEETGLEVEVGRLLWIVEHFYTHEGMRVHELGFYYLMTLPVDAGHGDGHPEFTGQEGTMPITFRWFPIEQLPQIRLYPAFLMTALVELPSAPVHLVYTDVDEEAMVSTDQIPGP